MSSDGKISDITFVFPTHSYMEMLQQAIQALNMYLRGDTYIDHNDHAILLKEVEKLEALLQKNLAKDLERDKSTLPATKARKHSKIRLFDPNDQNKCQIDLVVRTNTVIRVHGKKVEKPPTIVDQVLKDCQLKNLITLKLETGKFSHIEVGQNL